MSGSLAMILLLSLAGCNSAGRNQAGEAGDDNHVVIERRDDGTRSSAGTVDENGYMHGVLVNYYEDGKTVHSRITYEHGAKRYSPLAPVVNDLHGFLDHSSFLKESFQTDRLNLLFELI